jgi:septal ring factor EnvC (AmiA/AmiB activator)
MGWLMKTEMNQTIIDELNQVFSPDDAILDSLEPQENPSRKSGRNVHLSNTILIDVITDLTRAKFIWQCIAVCLMIAVLASGFMCFTLYSNSKNINEKYLAASKAQLLLTQSTSENEKLKSDILKTESALKTSQNQLSESKAETANLQQKLDSVSTQLKDLQDRNAEVLKILNGRLQKLSTPETSQRH